MEAITRILTPTNIQYMLGGAGYSILVAIVALLGGSILGLLSAAAKMSKYKVLRAIANVYVEVLRGTPMLLQILIVYLCGPVLTKSLFNFVYTPNVYVVGMVAIAINSGAYETELFRSAIQSIDRGQSEAAQMVGLTYVQSMRYVILPQAFKRVLPPFINEFIVLIKDTSLLSSIGAVELLHSAEILAAKYYTYFIPLGSAAVIYLAITLTISAFARKLERRLSESD